NDTMRTFIPEGSRLRCHGRRLMRNWIAVIAGVMLAVPVFGQNLSSPSPAVGSGTPPVLMPGFPGVSALAGVPGTISGVGAGDAGGVGVDAAQGAQGGGAVRSGRPLRVTLEQVRQQSANRVAAPVAYLSQLSVEAARQHRLGVQADYYPKFGAT